MRLKKITILIFSFLAFMLIVGASCIYLFLNKRPYPAQTQKNGQTRSFGVHPGSARNYSYARDLGLNFNREGYYFIWEWSDPDKNSGFSFKKAACPENPDRNEGQRLLDYDRQQARLSAWPEITMMRNICPFRGGSGYQGEFENEQEKNTYYRFVQKTVERYDGDKNLGCELSAPDCYKKGDNEHPSEKFIETLKKNPVKYWQVCNHLTDTCLGKDCLEKDNYAEKYAEVQKTTYEAAKSVCPDCKLLIAGDSKLEMYPPVFQGLNGRYIDAIDKHFFGTAEEYEEMIFGLSYLKRNLEENHFDVDKMEFWITETGTYSGDPADPPSGRQADLPYQSEKQQAESLVKRYAVAFGQGVKKVLWAWGLVEGFNCDCCLFDYTGLIYDGNKENQKCDTSDIYDQGEGVKKLAYYSFKLLIEKIKGFNKAETISDSGNFIYKFEKPDKNVYIAWNEKGGQALITGFGAKKAIITESVPAYEAGKEINGYGRAFNSYEKTADKEKNLRMRLSEIPVIIEEKL